MRCAVSTGRFAGIGSCFFICHLGVLASGAWAADAAAPDSPLTGILVVAPTPLPGTTIDVDKIPGVVQSLLAADLRADGAASLSAALDARLSSISSSDTLDDQFQPDILYRGFAASPVLGAAQGLAVYQNGVRINEAFGDTVNWDLVPDLAIARIDLISSNPSYGLNALGGALALTMKNGFDFPGGEAELYGGSFEQRAGSMQYGGNDGRFGIYAAARVLNQDGWRRFAGDTVHQFYTDLAMRSDPLSVDVSFSYADNGLNGQGAAPVQELAVSPSLVFTDPQQNTDRVDFLSVGASLRQSAALSWQAVLYLRDYTQDVQNGNTTSFVPCATAPGYLCQGDGATALFDAAGARVPDPSRSGLLPLGEDDLESVHALGSGGSLQFSDASSMFAHANLLTIGVAVDAARVKFSTSTLPGVINASQWVVPSGPAVATPEGTAFASTPVQLRSSSQDGGLYLTDTIDAGENFAVTASGRYNEAIIDTDDQRGSALTGRNRYSHFNPALGATFKLHAGFTAFANYSVNNRAPTASEIECSDPRRPCLLPSDLAGDPPALRQVVAQTAEFGLRGKYAADETSVSWNLGLFRTALDDDIYAIATSTSSGYFQNIGTTRREGIEAGLESRAARWSAWLQYSLVEATFQSPFTEHSPSNPAADAAGNIAVLTGDRLPGIPRSRLKLGADMHWPHGWALGAEIIAVGSSYYAGDESNQNAPLPGYAVVNLHASYHPASQLELFASLRNLLDRQYATYGLYSDPLGVGAPGATGGDNRFQSPAAPRAFFGGVRLTF